MKKRTLYWILTALFTESAICARFGNEANPGVGLTIVTVIALIALAVGMAALARKTDPAARFKRRARNEAKARSVGLPGDYVSFGLETARLLDQAPRIIELGAVRIRNGRVFGTYSQLVNSGKPIPPKVTSLTGLDDSMVAGSPSPRRYARNSDDAM